jgi:hypothetical protein
VSFGGASPSTLADVLRYVVALFAQMYPPWASGTPYAAGTLIGSSGAPWVCYAPGTSAGPAGPSGLASQTDAGGVGWTPLIYVGERYDRQEGATPRLYFRPSPKERMAGVLEIGDRQVASRIQACDVFVWGAETTADLDRYDAADALLDLVIAGVFTAGAGRIAGGDVDRQDGTSIETLGEEYRWHFEYARLVPRSDAIEAAAAALALMSKSPDDPDRPNGGNGLTPQINVVVTNTR